jgi:hypothetical protein
VLLSCAVKIFSFNTYQRNHERAGVGQVVRIFTPRGSFGR